MAVLQAIPVGTQKNVYSKNLLPQFCTFNQTVDFTGWNTVTGNIIASNTPGNAAKGDRYLSLFSTDTSIYAEVNSGGTETRFTATQSKLHRFQFWVRNPSGGKSSGDLVRVKMALNGVGGWNEINVRVDQMNGIYDVWMGFYYSFNLTAGQYIDFSFVIPINGTGSSTVHLDCLKMECDDKFLGATTEYTEPEVLLPSIPTDGAYFLKANAGFTSWQEIKLEEVQIDFGNVVAGSKLASDYSLSGYTVGAGQLMIVTPVDDTVAGSGLLFTAKPKTGDPTKITIIAHNPTSADINPGVSYYNVTIF